MFRFDWWLGEEPLKNQFPLLFASANNKSSVVWVCSQRRAVATLEEAPQLMALPELLSDYNPSQAFEKWTWTRDPEGVFFVKGWA